MKDDELSLLQNAEFKEAFDEFDQVICSVRSIIWWNDGIVYYKQREQKDGSFVWQISLAHISRQVELRLILITNYSLKHLHHNTFPNPAVSTLFSMA